MIAVKTRQALKEWAVTIKALDEGKQILLLRKGGIREKTFKVDHQEFLLYPTYEHQKRNLLKEPLHSDLDEVMARWDGDTGCITFTHWARVVEFYEVLEDEKLASISPCHIWTEDYAEKRLHWRPKKPLEIMLLRVYRLAKPQTVPLVTYYAGCKSWVELEEGVPLEGLTPVLSDEEFEAQARKIREALG